MAKRILRAVVLCSGSASSLQYLLGHDTSYGKVYEVVGLFSNVTDASGLTFAQDHSIPTDVIDFKDWREKAGVPRADLKGREPYFAQVTRIIREWNPDFIIMSGFDVLITDPLLNEYSGKMLNVHPAFLSILNDDGSRRYTGNGVVARAMEAGDPTGSTIHLVTKETDGGPIVFESSSLPYEPGDDPKLHQEKMKTSCDGPAYKRALQVLFSEGWPSKPW